MASVAAHGYVGIKGGTDAWRRFAAEILGLAEAPGSDAERLLLRMDERAWRIAVEAGDEGLAYCGWELTSPSELRALSTRLESAGVVVKDAPALARHRRVANLVVTEDPAGNQVELFCGAAISADPFLSPQGVRFVTGADQPGDLGFGHAVVTVPDLDAALDFYMGLLGFEVSDTVSVRGH